MCWLSGNRPRGDPGRADGLGAGAVTVSGFAAVLGVCGAAPGGRACEYRGVCAGGAEVWWREVTAEAVAVPAAEPVASRAGPPRQGARGELAGRMMAKQTDEAARLVARMLGIEKEPCTLNKQRAALTQMIAQQILVVGAAAEQGQQGPHFVQEGIESAFNIAEQFVAEAYKRMKAADDLDQAADAEGEG